MNCYNHVEIVSVAQCIDCGKGLCKSCASLYKFPICNQCNAIRVNNEKSQLFKKYLTSIIFALVGFIFGFYISSKSHVELITKISFTFLSSYIFAGIPWGWFVVSFITPKVFLFLSWFGWVVYFIIKLMLSYFIGIVAMPIGIINTIIKHRRVVKNEKYIQQNE